MSVHDCMCSNCKMYRREAPDGANYLVVTTLRLLARYRGRERAGTALTCLGLRGLSLVGLLLIGRPQREVVTKQLHDESGVLVGIFRDVVELSDSVLEGGAGHLAGLLWVAQHFVLEDGVVEDEAKADRVRHSQVLLRDLLGGLVSFPCALGGLALILAGGELRDVAVVVSLHLLVEDLRL